ncbi:unnamed protein product [Auanema sp. JU1783]|nr:unnamed protein product [Auanema sp. JU1783]
MSDLESSANAPQSPVPSQRKRLYGSRSYADEVIADVDLAGRTILITGTSSGIGIETAKALAVRGAHVVMANRNLILSEKLKNEILEKKSDAKIDLIMCDLSSLQSVQAAAKEFKSKHWPLHVLILNAGVFGPVQKTTIDGLESCFGINHVAHQYLIRELLPVIRQTENSRIVIVSSLSHTHAGMKPTMSTNEKVAKIMPKDATENLYRLYSYSKLCNILTAMKLHRDENKNGISVYVLHPGTMIGTDINRGFGVVGKAFNFMMKPFVKNLSQGASTTVYCAASPEVAQISGKYWEGCWDDEKNLDKEVAHDEALQEALWQKTDEIIDQFELKRQPISTLAEN